MQKPDSSNIASFQTWKKLGRSVTKGEKGIKVLVPIPYKYDKEVYKFALYLLKEAKKNSDNINLIIKVSSDNWKIEHIGLVEKCIIDIAIAEFLDKGNNIPFKATISEAVLLAIKYGGKDSKSYVNGVLDKAAELTGAKSKE